MKIQLAILFILPLFLILSCDKPKSEFEGKYTTESAQIAIQYAKRLQQNQPVTDADWDLLFNTEGYLKFLNLRDSIMIKQAIKDGFILSFNESRKAELDSILSVQLQDNDNFDLRRITISNIHNLTGRLNEAQSFLDNTNFIDLLEKAHQKTKEYLPESAYNNNPTLNNLYFICRWADASVRGNAVFFDLTLALDYTEEEMIDVLAHEFHHNYRDMILPGSFEDPLLDIINSIHAEGIADLIDKGEPPLKKMGDASEKLVEMYNNDMVNTPAFLQAIDSITVAYTKGEMNDTTFGQIRQMLKYGGHANGHYMALLIRNNNGMQDLINTYDNPVAFVKLYNDAAAKKEGEHVFSHEFIEYLEDAKRKQKD